VKIRVQTLSTLPDAREVGNGILVRESQGGVALKQGASMGVDRG